MPEEVGVAFVRLRPDTAGFAEEARSEVGGALRSTRESAQVPVRATVNKSQAEATMKRDIGAAAKSAMAYVGGIFAAQEVFHFGKEVVSEAALVQKAQETIRSEYGKSADSVERFAGAQATQFGISTAASETASAKLGALFNNLGFGQRKSADFTLGLQKVVGAMSQIKGVDPTSILDRLNTTMATGSTRGLRDLGIALDSTTVKAEAMRLGLVKTTVDTGKLMQAQDSAKQAQSNLAKVQDQYGQGSKQFHEATIKNVLAHEALQKAIAGTAGPMTVQAKDQAIISLVTQHQSALLAEANKHQGDAANQAKILSAEWQNMKASIGEALLPVFTTFVQELVKGVDFLKEHRDAVVNVAEAIGIAVTAYTALKAVAFATNLATEIGSGAWKLMTGNVRLASVALTEQQVKQKAAAAGTAAYDAAIAAGATEQDALAASTAAASAETEALNSAMLLNPATIVAVAVVALAVGLYELYQHSATARRIMNELWADLKHFGMEALGWIAHTGIPEVRGAITGMVNWTEREWHRWGSDITAVARAAWDLVKIEIRLAVNVIRDVFNIVNDLVHGRWGAAWGAAKRLVSDMVHGAISILRSLAGDAAQLVAHIGPAILGEAGRLVRDAERIGSELVHGIVSGIEHAPGDVANAVKGKAEGALSAVGSALGIGSPSRVFAQKIGKPISDGIILGAQPLHDDLRDQMVNQLTRLRDQYGPLWHDQFHDQVGRPISQGVVAGTAPLQGDLGDALVRAAHGAIAHAKSALGIHSPSSLFSEQVGKPIADGILHGMGGLEQALTRRITSAAQAAASSAGGSFGGGVTPQGGAAVGYNQRLGYQMMLAAGWGADQWGALQALWTRESGWNANAVNASSGAYGIPQSLGHGHPYNLGDARAQIAWGLDYIRARYGSPGAAWAHEEAIGWYGAGGVQAGSPTQAYPAMLHGGEVVFTPEQMNMLGHRGIHIDQLIVQTQSAHELVSELDHIARSL